MKYQDWQVWGKRPEQLITLEQRAEGNLPEMESTKQLVKIISEVYKPGMQILDVGCNTGHYLKGIRKIDDKLDYTGVDAYEHYINKAKEIFLNDKFAKFHTRDILEPLFPSQKFDIVYCCNVILHLPDFRIAMKNLLDVTKNVCIIRTLLGDNTTKVKFAYTQDYNDEGEPLDFCYFNTWKQEFFIDYIKKMGWNVEIIEDQFNPTILKDEFEKVKKNSGTNVINEKQVDGNIIFNWVWLIITKP